ncbi:MAG: hypothetical protein LVQ95_01635 [Candidatus Micrarchaeales archaeon]|nr:hypothetical protein [Candidatus Micrarchaeales archaeon]
MKQQSAIDFMTSYGVAMLIVVIAAYVVLRLGIFTGNVAQPVCTSASSFSCGALSLSTNGTVTFVLTQAVGGTIDIVGVACSSGINTAGTGPAYGNINVLNYSDAPQYYPSTALQSGLQMYSGSSKTIRIGCWGPFGQSKENLGNSYTGYIWINYTYEGLPSHLYTVTRVIDFATKAT